MEIIFIQNFDYILIVSPEKIIQYNYAPDPLVLVKKDIIHSFFLPSYGANAIYNS